MNRIPEIPIESLVVRAHIDYLKVYLEVHGAELLGSDLKYKWIAHVDGGWILTIHDASPADLRKVVDHLENPMIWALEISVDFHPKDSVSLADRPALLETTFTALAARFRPEDKLNFGAGFKGAFASGGQPKPFHDRIPRVNEELVYGHRNEGQGAKLYLKVRDHGHILPANEHRVRIETTLARLGINAVATNSKSPLNLVNDLLRGNLRRLFAGTFRVIDGPEVKRSSKYEKDELERMEKAMWRGWNKAGVGAFASSAMPADSSIFAKQAAEYRAGKLLPLASYRLRRHTHASLKIGEALRNLDRRLRARFSGDEP